MAKWIKGTNSNFDPEFRFLLDLDPALEGWRAWAAEYWAGLPKTTSNMKSGLTAFLVTYLHGQGLHTLPPEKFLARDRTLPKPDAALGLALMSYEDNVSQKHDAVSDFLDWMLREKLSVSDADGHRVVPPQLANPFPRRSIKKHGKTSDLSFAHVLLLDPKLEDWRSLAAEWLKDQKSSVGMRRNALDDFLVLYIHGQNLERNYRCLLLRATEKPDFAQVIVAAKREGTQTLRAGDVKSNNTVADFLDWVLANKLGDPDTGEWDRSRFHNPVQRLTTAGLPTNNQSDKASLSIRYIRELRGMLTEGRNFRDWTWAQQAMEDGKNGGDWFVVDPQLIDPNDSDCVARQRAATWYEIENKGYPTEVWELWSPVRAIALYLKLELPLRTFQVRMLDSGKADTWRYVHAPGGGGGGFVLNHGALTTGSAQRPYQRGVFHHSANEQGAGLYINTNKTANSNKAENEKGYVIPWGNDEVLYWLEKLRNWQARYNPIAAPTPWMELERKHFGITPPLRFVNPDSETATYFPLHALRVSLISYFILDLKLPIAVVSKMIAGHATIIMTLYYTKFGKAYMREVLREAEKHELEAEQANHRRFLQDATFEQVTQRFAYVSEDAVRAAIQSRSAAAFVFDDKGICPNGATLCDVGGERRLDRLHEQVYGPVSGFPQERNCACCRFFLTGPAFLPGLIAHFNIVSEKTHRQSVRYSALQDKLTDLEDRRRVVERENQPFLHVRELGQLNKYAEAEALILNKYVNDLQATNHLIQRSLLIAADRTTDGVKFVAKGSMTDLKVGFIESQSVLHQLEVVCENAVIYPEIDAGFATIRRAQMLDAMLRYNGMDPVLMYLDQEIQLLVGNAVMQLIQARTGSIKGALPYAECHLKLKEIGLLKDQVLNEIAQVKAQALLDHAKAKRALTPPKEDYDDAS
ncbi:integrase family protein [Vogesella indigofera]|uniref:integrase family protein n=1 Tax=Vogesella indigofera TaxID=45465 RepID=UPI0035B0D587